LIFPKTRTHTNIVILQPIVKSANPSIVEPLLNLLKTLHLEVQYEGTLYSFSQHTPLLSVIYASLMCMNDQ